MLAALAAIKAPTLAPSLFSASMLAAPVLAPALPLSALSAPALPVVSLQALPAPAALPVPTAARAISASASARPLAVAVESIRQARAEPAAAAPVLDRLYEARAVPGSASAPVFAAAASASPARLAVRVNAVRAEAPAEPPAPQPGWKKAATLLGRTASVLVGLWGGTKLGDVAYALAFAKLAPFGLLAALPAAAALAWYLRRRQAGLASRLGWAAMLGTFSFSALGQLAWDLTGSPLGLLAGMALGAALALYAGGLRRGY
ncbi:MAG: hypothetical protein HY928_14200 [Elusimicrobia bacterium]|nr:hypothetical protein [Elusimicrobiota bacterium]